MSQTTTVTGNSGQVTLTSNNETIVVTSTGVVNDSSTASAAAGSAIYSTTYFLASLNNAGLIEGGFYGVADTAGIGDVTNSGIIEGNKSSALQGFNSTGNLYNSGKILALGVSVGASWGNGYATNTSTGTISGYSFGMMMRYGDTFENNGLVESSNAAAIDLVLAGNVQTLILDPESVIHGAIQFSGTSLVDDNILLAGGTGGPAFNLAATLALENTANYFSTYGFATNAQRTLVATSTELSGKTIANLRAGDALDLTDISATSATFAAGMLNLYNGSSLVETLTLSDPNATANSHFFAISDGAGGTDITSDVACFAAGTRILTPNGETLVENLRPDDLVITAKGETRPIIWVGARIVDLTRHAMAEKIRPVRIIAGAFGDGLPERDLRVSPDHALFIDGHLIEAKTLINGVTIIQESATKLVTYYHIELAQHDVLLAEGLPAESYLDSGNRGMFADGASALSLHPDFTTECRAAACAPLLLEGETVNAIRSHLLERIAAFGYTTTDDIDLVVRANGVLHKPVKIVSGNELFFLLPEGVRYVDLLSSVGVPAETSPDPRDRRSLGVAVAGMTLESDGSSAALPLYAEGLTGFYDPENGQRWTNGAARVALPAYQGTAMLVVTLRGQAARWRLHPAQRGADDRVGRRSVGLGSVKGGQE